MSTAIRDREINAALDRAGAAIGGYVMGARALYRERLQAEYDACGYVPAFRVEFTPTGGAPVIHDEPASTPHP
jgi:hypothetical protein